MKNFQNDKFITIRGGRHHNLKSVDIDLPHGKLIVITGPSGSGKSSLALDTIYGESQRRYMESISGYARQFLNIYPKPEADFMGGLSPAIAIDQNATMRNPRSTVGTVTEIQDYLRVLFARAGVLFSPATGLPIQKQSIASIVDTLCELPLGTKIRVCASIVRNETGSHDVILTEMKKKGYERVKIDDKMADLSSPIKLDKNVPHTIEVIIDRIIITEESRQRLSESVETAIKLSKGSVSVDFVDLGSGIEEFKLKDGRSIKNGESLLFSEKFACPVSNFEVEIIEPKIFSFNSPYGACPTCAGLGEEVSFKKSLIVPDEGKTLRQGAIEPWAPKGQRYCTNVLGTVAKYYGFSLDVPFSELSEEHKNILFYGSGEEEIEFTVENGLKKEIIRRPFSGAISELESLENEMDDFDLDSLNISKYRDLIVCHKCNGYRLKESSLCVKVGGRHIGEVCEMPVNECLEWFKALPSTLTDSQKIIATPLLKDICDRLGFLIGVGLDYLTLSRSATTLSGGEAQRIRLASQIGSGLCGVTYVLDEPTIGLHQADNQKLISTLKKLRDMGNTVIVVEHDVETILSADYLVDVGPCAGEKGGYIMAHGTVEEVIKDPKSITGAFLSGREAIEVPRVRRKFGRRQFIEVVNATEHNLKSVSIKIPLGMLIAVCGVSGGGKSSLIIDTLYKSLAMRVNGASERPGKHDEVKGVENIDKVIKIDQSAIGRTPRSNPATFVGVFTLIRDLFASLPMSRIRGYKPGRFSFNTKGGRCENCRGDGMIKVEMHMLPDIYIECDICKGKRYNDETLEVKYNGKNIAEVLHMNASEALKFFANMPAIKEKFLYMEKVGLGYVSIGQSATTLSGGESQRIKLAKELSRKSTGDTFYILDEPTTGLHTSDIKKLIAVLQELVDAGNTVLVIEHNIDVIKTADYVFDIGPKGGKEGGYIVAQGTPEEIVVNSNSVTGPFLKPELDLWHEKHGKNKPKVN